MKGCNYAEPAVSWLTLLRSLPLLEELELADCIVPLGVPPSAVRRPTWKVTLPRLQHLYLKDGAVGTAYAELLRHLIIPAVAQKSLRSHTRGSQDDHRYIFSSFANQSSDGGAIGRPAPFRSLIIDRWLSGYARHKDFAFILSPYLNNLYAVGSVDDDGDDDETLGASSFNLIGDADCMTQMLLDIFALSETEDVEVNAANLLSIASWEAINRLPNVRIVHVGGTIDVSLTTFIQFLERKEAFLKLEYLSFNSYQWNVRHKSKRKRAAREGSLMVRLIKALERRKDIGMPRLRHLSLGVAHNVDLKEDGFAQDRLRLRKLVDQLEYDLDRDATSCGTCVETDKGEDDADDTDTETDDD